MIRYFFILLIFISCNVKHQPEFNEPVFRYAASRWMMFTPEDDSFRFNLIQYLDVDKKGNFRCIKKTNLIGERIFFSGKISDSIMSKINSVVNNNNYKKNYLWDSTDGFTYDGYDYVFQFEDKQKNLQTIYFITPKAPQELNSLCNKLATFVDTLSQLPTDTFKISDFELKLKNVSRITTPPPIMEPPMIKLQKNNQ
jgi:hypothetical protein